MTRNDWFTIALALFLLVGFWTFAIEALARALP